jgi:hypothetical protein
MIIACRVCFQFRLPTVACQELRILSVTWPLHGTDLSIKSIIVDAAGCFIFSWRLASHLMKNLRSA